MADIEVDQASLDRIILHLQTASQVQPVTADITVSGKPADYYAATEFGSGKGRRPWPNAGPRTAESNGRIFSSQAVGGYVHKNDSRFVDFLKRAYLEQAEGDDMPTRQDLIAAANDAASQAHAQIVAGAPYDSGELKSSIRLEGAK